jgi:hypothetical protein
MRKRGKDEGTLDDQPALILARTGTHEELFG